MLLVYKPKDGEVQRFPIEFDEMTLAEIEDIENYSGRSFRRFVESFDEGRISQIRPLLFVFLKRANPLLRYRDVNPKLSEVSIDQERGELEALRERVEADPDWPDREETLVQIDAALAELLPDEAPGKGEDSPSPTASTTGRSRKSATTTKRR